MDKKVYERTRYQNIYRHKKNKNYVIMISNPVKTSISRIEGKKILRIEDAVKIRDNPKIKMQRGLEAQLKDDFNTLWDKYIYDCENVKKLAFNTLQKKKKIFNRYLNNSFKNKISKITKVNIIYLLNSFKTTDKQKNEILEELKAFFNWCVKEEFLINSPASNINKFKIQKSEMKYWIPEELENIIKVLNDDINSNNLKIVKKARLVKLLIFINFSLGDRIGETRALTYDSFDSKLGIVKIQHSINYDRKASTFVDNTKNYHSQREVDVSDKIINEVNDYKEFLKKVVGYNVNDNDLIFFNYNTMKPYSDVTLRKNFYYYCDKAKVEKIRMYDLRHTYVTTMMGEGKELYHISTRIGHSSYSTTVNKYGHLSLKKRKEIAKITDKYI